MYNYIRKDVVVAAIKWLDKNKLYEGIELNDSWTDEWINSQYSSFLSETEYDNVQPDKDELANNNYTTTENINKASKTVSHNKSEISCEQATENREFNEDQNATQVSIQLSGRPTSNILEFEHIENKIYTCAPGENNVPHYILMDDEFGVLSFPDMFAHGQGGYSTDGYRKTKLSKRKYF